MDLSAVFLDSARARAAELGVAGRVTFVHGDASGYVAATPAGIAACLGATWIGGGVAGTVRLLRRSLAPGGMMLIGEPYWRREPPDQATVEACDATGRDDWRPLPELARVVRRAGLRRGRDGARRPGQLGPLRRRRSG